MKQGDFDSFSQLISAIGDLYGKSQSEWAISIWWGALENYDLAAIREALSRHAKNPDNGQFMPKPADVVRMMQGSTLDSALHAWAKVDRAVRQVGTYQDVVFDDPLIHRVLNDMGGWIGFGQKTENEWPFVAKEFENRYRGFAARGEVPEYPPVMVGLSTAYNGQNGYKSQPPVMIGNAHVAQNVMQGGAARDLIRSHDAGERAAKQLAMVA